MDKQKKKAIFITIGIVLIALKSIEIATEPNFGFANTWSGEGIGFNLAHIGLLVLGVWLLVAGIRLKK